MTNAAQSDESAGRRQWLAVLARAGRDELEACVAGMGPLPAFDTVRPAEIAMVMLRGRVGGSGDPFNLGEASLTRCAVRPAGGMLGVGYTLGRDRRKAELVALLDALLQEPARCGRLLQDIVVPLRRGQEAQRHAASAAAASSRVDFFTLVRGAA